MLTILKKKQKKFLKNIAKSNDAQYNIFTYVKEPNIRHIYRKFEANKSNIKKVTAIISKKWQF